MRDAITPFHRPNRMASNRFQRTRARPLPSARRLIAMLMAAIVFAMVATVLTLRKQLARMGPNDPTPGLPLVDKTPRLRFDWTNLPPSLLLTNRIVEHQNNCSLPLSTFTYRNRFGLGSDLHIYGEALAYGIHTHKRIRTVGNWTWMDQTECNIVDDQVNSKTALGSPMRCYFEALELNCPGDLEYALKNPGFDAQGGLSKPNGNLLTFGREDEVELLRTKDLLKRAVVESLFTRVTPRVVQEAERQLKLVFGGEEVPKDLITVHIRWGDKVASFEGKNKKVHRPEMKKVEISDYINAIHKILDKREKAKKTSPNSAKREANIYLATEDPEAVKEFRKVLPEGWNLYVDQFLTETIEHRTFEYNASPKVAQALNGRAGLFALGSLLVAMEANDFVLTTKSNWSELMDELRRAILNPRCGDCTSLIDLRPNKG